MQDRWRRRSPLYEQTFDNWWRLLGPDHPRTMRSSNYLASAYREAGRLSEAIPLYERTLSDRWRLLGPDHPSTLRSSSYLARTYREAGRLSEAIPLFERTLAGWHHVLGPNHPSTLRSSYYLARTYREAGLLSEAISLCEGTLTRCTRVLGDDHSLTRKVSRHLSVTYALTASRGHTGPSAQGEYTPDQHASETADSRYKAAWLLPSLSQPAMLRYQTMPNIPSAHQTLCQVKRGRCMSAIRGRVLLTSFCCARRQGRPRAKARSALQSLHGSRGTPGQFKPRTPSMFVKSLSGGLWPLGGGQAGVMAAVRAR